MLSLILVVDDDKDIRHAVGACLRREGFNVCLASNGREALNVMSQGVDLVVLDVMMPELDGHEVVCKARAQGFDRPIIFLTARDEEFSQVLGLGLGADDYVNKPFSCAALAARIKAHLRRYQQLKDTTSPASIIRQSHLEINLSACEVALKGVVLTLTAKEYELLCYLASNPGQVFTREQLFRQVWGNECYGEENTVTVHISRLREKIEENPAAPRYIVTMRGLGYRFMSENKHAR